RGINRYGRGAQGVKVMNMSATDHVSAAARLKTSKKKAPKHADGQLALDLAAAGARDADEEDPVDIGTDEIDDDELLDDEE
ncbi:MAG TPA: hypothetical protein PK071_00935, partial [Atopobiaceae bacterium]|nr:hypothetical protein [Atopobiaceae bacterium]